VYDLKNSVPGSEEVFEPFADYYAPDNIGPSKVTVVSILDPSARYNALASGQVNVIDMPADFIDRSKRDGFEYTQSLLFRPQLQFKDTAPGSPFEDVRVRRAMCYALDRDSISAVQYGGFATLQDQLVPVGSPGHSDNVTDYPHDPDKARDLLQEAGNPNITFTLPVYNGVEPMHQVIAQNLSDVGITVELAQLTRPQYFTAALTPDYKVYFNAGPGIETWVGGPLSYYQQNLTPTAAFNPFKVAYPELDEIMKSSIAAAPGSVEQDAAWQLASQYITEQALSCGYIDAPSIYAYDPDVVKFVDAQDYSPLQVLYNSAQVVE
jgi:peptide/nickel transport system substrate-binding protein